MADNRKSWTFDQDQAILSIVASVGTKNWPLVSQLMKGKYQLYQRSGKQCRQRWHNHLNPQLNKQPWSQSEQQMLFQAHRNYGNKWIQISKLFGGRYHFFFLRTDNSIKNHFYSTIRRSMRRVCKILGNRNSTSKLRNIRPSILSEIFQFSKTQSIKSFNGDQSLDIATCLLQYARQKPKKSTLFDPSSKDDLEMLVNRLILLNDQYVKFKSEKKNTQIKCLAAKKIIKKPKNPKLIQKTQQLSETHSEKSESEEFERQHKDSVEKSNTVDSLIEQQPLKNSPAQISNEQIQEEDEGFSMGDELEIESLQSRYLIIKPLQVHSMFDSTENFDEKQHQVFHYLEKPSFHQIGYQEHEDIFEIISFQ